MAMAMLSFHVDEQVAAAARRWSQRLGIERSELMREALRRHLVRLASEHEAEIYDAQPLTDEEMSPSLIADWGPAEDWSDWSDAAR